MSSPRQTAPISGPTVKTAPIRHVAERRGPGYTTCMTSVQQMNLSYYRFYCRATNGGIIKAHEAHIETDEAALAHAKELLDSSLDCVAIEAWSLARFVG